MMLLLLLKDPLICKQISNSLNYPELIYLASLDPIIQTNLQPLLNKFKLVLKYAQIWYRLSETSRPGEVMYIDHQMYTYLPVPGSNFRYQWVKSDLTPKFELLPMNE